MIALCAHVGETHLRPETIQALSDFWQGDIHYSLLDAGDVFSYSYLLSAYWDLGESFAVIEPDIVIRADVDDAFHNCPEPYCCFPYAWQTHVGPALGCTRFRAEFLARFPDAMQKATRHRIGWRQLDVVLLRHVLAREYKQQPHVHLPPVEHLNPRQQARADAPLLLEVPLQ